MADEEMCNCGMPGCKKTLKQAEDEYRSGIVISTCALHWPLLYRLHRILKKLQKKYPSFDAAKSDPHWHEYHEVWEAIQMRIDEELWKVEEYKKKYGRYPGMERQVVKDDGRHGAEAAKIIP